MKFTQLAKSIKEEGLGHIYLIEGEETYFRDHAVRCIREACALTQPSLNDVRYEGELLKGDALSNFLSELSTMPFFNEKRLVRVYEFYPSEREWESLKSYCATPCPTTVLVIVNSATNKKSDLKRKSGVIFIDCGKESEETLSRWFYGICRRLGIAVDGDAASLMVQYCNLNAARMNLEARKLKELLGENGKITRAVVEEYVAKDVEYKIYELTNAVARRNFSAFSEILHDLMEKGYDENAALASLTSYFRSLAEISGMRGSDAEIVAALGMKPYPVQKNREAVLKLGKERVREYYLRLYELSAGMRSGNLTKSGALSAAISKIFFG